MNFLDKMKNKVTAIIDDRGGAWTSPDEKSSTVDARLAECRSCENFIKITSTCTQCGCFMKFKTQIKNAKCPIGKW